MSEPKADNKQIPTQAKDAAKKAVGDTPVKPAQEENSTAFEVLRCITAVISPTKKQDCKWF